MVEKVEKKVFHGWCSHHFMNMPSREDDFEVLFSYPGEQPSRPAKGWDIKEPWNSKWHPFSFMSGEGCYFQVSHGGGDFWALFLCGPGLPEGGELITNGNGQSPNLAMLHIPSMIISSSTVLDVREIRKKLREKGFDWEPEEVIGER